MPLAPVGGASADALLGLGARSGLGLASGAAADHRGCPPLGSCRRPRWRGIAVPPRPFRAALLDSGAGVDTMLSSILLPEAPQQARPAGVLLAAHSLLGEQKRTDFLANPTSKLVPQSSSSRSAFLAAGGAAGGTAAAASPEKETFLAAALASPAGTAGAAAEGSS